MDQGEGLIRPGEMKATSPSRNRGSVTRSRAQESEGKAYTGLGNERAKNCDETHRVPVDA